jgi:hypothetical protein
MKRTIEVTTLGMTPDWATSDFPAGLYYDSNSMNLCFYRGDKNYPFMVWNDQAYQLKWKNIADESEIEKELINAKVPRGVIPYEELIKLIAVIRTQPDNLKIGEIV